MSNKEIAESVATVLGVDWVDIERQVNVFIRSGSLFLYGNTRPYWLKTHDTIALTGASSDYLINFKDHFNDFMRLKLLWITGSSDDNDGILEEFTEGRFRREYPDDTDTGTPVLYYPRDKDNIQLHPRPNATLTLNISYYYRPEFQSVADIPEEWQHVILHYCLMMYQPEKWSSLFWASLKDVINEARYSEEGNIEILQDSFGSVVRSASEDMVR